MGYHEILSLMKSMGEFKKVEILNENIMKQI
jgi:hypothetical protein